jgi:hypothetical protein
VREEFVPEPSQPILVGDHQRCDLARNDGINQLEACRTGEVQPAADLGNPLVYRESACGAERLKRTALMLQIGFLRLTRHPERNDGFAWRLVVAAAQMKHLLDMRIGGYAPIPWCSLGGESSRTIPSLSCLHGYADPLRTLTHGVCTHTEYDSTLVRVLQRLCLISFPGGSGQPH